MSYIDLYMPRCGEDGVIIAQNQDGIRVEFRGSPYSTWEIDEDTPMIRLHSCLKRINISELHCSKIERVTPWHIEWNEVKAMFDEALIYKD